MKRRIVMYNKCVCMSCCKPCGLGQFSAVSDSHTMDTSDRYSISYTISVC